LASVGLALSSIAPPSDALDRDKAADSLGQLVDDINTLLEGSMPDNQDALHEFLTRLLRTADRDTAQSGEVLVRHP
jgi:hypothetical protein